MQVVIAEDSLLLRLGLRKVLESEGIEIATEVGDGAALIDAVAEFEPDLVIADVRMPPTFTDEGIRAVVEIRRRWPGTAVLVLSQYVEERYATDLLGGPTAGIGYLLKERVADVEDFLASLQRVAAGGTALDPEVVTQLIARRRDDPLERLTAREHEVLALMAQGLSNTEIGRALVVSDSAVAKHINNIFAKLDLAATDSGHRRVNAVLTFLNHSSQGAR